jgi:hypothetical protein
VGKKIGIVDEAMRWIAPPKFDAVDSTRFPNAVTAALAAARGKGGTVGMVVESIRTPSDRAFATLDGKHGIIDEDGNWIVEPLFDDLWAISEGRYVAGRDGKYGLLAADGRWLIEPLFEELKPLGPHILVRSGGKVGIYDPDLKAWVLEPSFEALWPGKGAHIVAQVGGKHGLYDLATKAWVVEPQFDRLCPFQENYLFGVTGPLRTLFDIGTGDILIGPRYNRLWFPLDTGLIAVLIGDKWGYADLSGTLVIPAQLSNPGTFKRGIAWAMHEGKACPLDRRGHWVEGIPCVNRDLNLGGDWLRSAWCEY